MAGPSHNPYAPPREQQLGPAEPKRDGPKQRLSGWMLVSLLGVIFVGGLVLVGQVMGLSKVGSPVVAVRMVWTNWQFGLVTVLSASLSIMAGFAVVWMLRRDRRLPRLMLVFYGVQAVFFTFAIIMREPSPSPTVAHEAGTMLGQAFWPLRCLLWMLYYGYSQRVKNTFVK